MKFTHLAKTAFAFVLSVCLVQCSNQQPSPLDETKFKTPAADKKIHVWWHWLDGAITKDGITKDLEAMKEQGVSQATILNVGLFNGKDFGVPRVKFNSDEWYNMFRWALTEANRLGIKIGVHNCDGWSSTGGPWITPEISMKQYTWTKTIVNGGKDLEMKLQMPQAIENYYKDVAVIAVKTKDDLNSFIQANPKIKLNDSIDGSALMDGCPVSSLAMLPGSQLNFSFQKPFTAQKIVVFIKLNFTWANPADLNSQFILYSSQDNKKFKKIEEFSIKGVNQSVSIPFKLISAKYYRLEIAGLNSTDRWNPVGIAEVELLRENEQALYSPSIPNLLEKSGCVKSTSEQLFYTKDTATSINFPSEKELINLTDKMSSDGTLKWTAPEGNWTILRFGYTSTAAHNGPATLEGRGLECDKMDTLALNLHYKNFPQKLINAAGQFTGNTFKFFLIDSWEAGYQNWTGILPSEFKKLRGYDLLNYLPVLCGETVVNDEVSEAVLYDFRKTIADLIEQNYYKHYRDLIHKSKLELHAEVIYGGTGYPSLDILKTTQYVDLPMYEFWAGQNPKTGFIEYTPSRFPELNFPAVAAIDYDKPMMASEAYTGFAHYSESPSDLKPYGDRAFCSGINQIILHSYVHQPFDKKPGMTLGQYASHFNRNNLYWQYISGWFNYQSRIEYVLQQGTTQPDVLYYLGDQLPEFYEIDSSNLLPFGYNLNACNFDVLKNKIKVTNGRLILSGKTSYGLLCLPSHPVMNFKTLQRIDELVSQGAVICGPKPIMVLSLADVNANKPAFNALADKIWGNKPGENKYGKGLVFSGVSPTEAIRNIKFLPDFETNRPDESNFLFIHKKIETIDAYFICNQQQQTFDRECIFKQDGKTPELWDPETGEVKQLAIYTSEDGRTRIPLHFGPRESMIIVFRENKMPDKIVTVKLDGKQVFPLVKESMANPRLPLACFTREGIEIKSAVSGEYTFITNSGKNIVRQIAGSAVFNINEFKGSIHFEKYYEGTIAPIEITGLRSLTEYDDPSIKYFSGVSKYKIEFKMPLGISATDRVLIDPGNFDATAEIILNGKKLGTIWKPFTELDISGLLKETNTLEVNVANVYRNRFIGDFVQYGKVQNLWTSSPIAQFLDKDKPLKPSGLMGPLRLIKENPIILR